MKKSISIFLCLALILSSCSFAFATPTSWDTSDQSNLQGILRAVTSYGTSNLYYYVSQIYSLTNTISNNINTIKGYLVDSGHGVAYWVSAIDSFMSPILNAIQQTPLDLEKIWLSLGTTYNDNGSTVYRPFLYDIKSGFFDTFSGTSNFTSWNNTTDTTNWTTFGWVSSGNILQQLMFGLRATNNNNMGYYVKSLNAQFGNYNQAKYGLNWSDLSQFSHVASSQSEGQNYWLSMIQQPVARLAYVLASDERIDAQEKAADNEQAVVDNFIDSTGSGAASTSDIDSIADFSSGYKSTFSSDASPTGIFNLFTSDNMSWFSQETYNQLDTTSNNRAKSDNTFNTPLLDQQINSIYEQLGVKQP